MSVIDVITCENKDGVLCENFPSDAIRLGSQLIVYPSQTAFFVKGGNICDEFSSGTYTIKSENIPILDKVINLPMGGKSPFKADVWFVNLVSKLNLQWGTPNPIQIEDPKYNIIVPVRSYGQYGIKVTNPRKFLENLIGNMSSFTSEQIDQYFKGKLISFLNSILAKQIIEEKCSILDINTLLIELSEKCEQQLNVQFEKYGLNIVEFSIMSINVPENDDSVIRLKKAKDITARLNITGRDVYQMERSFDVLEKAAANDSGITGLVAGLGAGMVAGGMVGNMAGQFLNTNPIAPPPLPQGKTYYIAINGSQIPNQNIQQIASYIQQGLADANTLVWAQGMSNWTRIADVAELSSLVSNRTPPPLP